MNSKDEYFNCIKNENEQLSINLVKALEEVNMRDTRKITLNSKNTELQSKTEKLEEKIIELQSLNAS